MVSNCANPKCHVSFKYFGTGQLFVSKVPGSISNSFQQELQWLCDNCAESFLFIDEVFPVSTANNSLTPQDNSSLPIPTGEQNVLLDCANSACAAIFISPNQGKLFKFNGSKPNPFKADRSSLGKTDADSKEAWFWLCDDCARHMTVRLVRGHAEVIPVRHSIAA